MSFPFYIARRYLFSKKQHNVINLISGISVVGVALATLAMVCVMSGFNGFQDLIGNLFTAFDPQLELVPTQGKVMAEDDPSLVAVRRNSKVAAATNSYEDNALILFKGRPLVIMLKGVDDNFTKTSGIKNILYGQGEYLLRCGNLNYGIPGYNLALQMGGLNFGTLQICVPKKGEQINLANPIENINVDDLTASGICFQVNQQKYDDNLMLCSLPFVQGLYNQEGCITKLELKLKDGVDEQVAKKELQQLAGPRFRVLNRYEQHEETFNVMQIEKLFAFAFLTFIVLVACFNIIGSVSMLIIDKTKDISTLRHLGATNKQIVHIFLFEGWLISFMGAIIGIVLGLIVCFLQQQFGLLKLEPTGGGNFIVDAYPISVHALDIVIIFFTVIIVGFLSVWYPVNYLSRKSMDSQA